MTSPTCEMTMCQRPAEIQSEILQADLCLWHYLRYIEDRADNSDDFRAEAHAIEDWRQGLRPRGEVL